MIDLNYLYTFSTYKAKDRAPTAYEYLTASALVKQSKQNFGKYYEGVLTERIEDCACDPNLPLNVVDIFILALDSLGYTVEDFIESCKHSTTQKLNELDTYFYHLMPDNRIFSAINEMRERGNTAFFDNVKYPINVKPFKQICTTDFLFCEPAKAGYFGSTTDGLTKMYHKFDNGNQKSNGKLTLSPTEVVNLLSIFYLKNVNGKFVFDAVDSVLEPVHKNPDLYLERICKMLGSNTDGLDAYDEALISDRNCVYDDIIDECDIGEYWDHCENYLNGLQLIRSSGEEKYTKSREGITKPVFEACSNKKVNRNRTNGINSNPNGQNDTDWTDIENFAITKQQCDKFKDRIVGQRMAVNEIVDKLAGVACGFYTPNKPIASFLMNGPTGVGKTETAKALADTFFGGRLYTVDMSTFKHASDVSRLIGSAPGYVGYDDKVALLEFIDKNPNGVINFDEIDKCDRSCLSFLLSILDEGRFTSAKGKEYQVQNFVITCTTNQNAQVSRKSENFNLDELMSRTGDAGTPFVKEFLGRFDSLLEYGDLNKTELKEVLSKKLDAKIGLFASNKPDSRISIEYRDRLLDNILQDANYMATGARALNGSIQKMFVRPISHYLIENADSRGKQQIVVAGDNTLVVNNNIVKLDADKDISTSKASKSESKHIAQQQYYA